jgi:uncharacterized membrane protein (UPF0136 family)
MNTKVMRNYLRTAYVYLRNKGLIGYLKRESVISYVGGIFGSAVLTSIMKMAGSSGDIGHASLESIMKLSITPVEALVMT